MDYYNNSAKPFTPPILLVFMIYWFFKWILLKVGNFILTNPLWSAGTSHMAQWLAHPELLVMNREVPGSTPGVCDNVFQNGLFP